MESMKILPSNQRMTELDIIEVFGDFASGSKMEQIVSKVLQYEVALREVENAFYKWRLDKTKNFSEYFVWNRIDDNYNISVSKLTYFDLLEKLRRYARVLHKAELFYEEQRARKLSQINGKYGK